MYYLYMLRCADKTLYTGITSDLTRRLEEHNESKAGAKYTKARRPVHIIFAKKYTDRSKASVAEAAMKKLSRTEKLALIRSN